MRSVETQPARSAGRRVTEAELPSASNTALSAAALTTDHCSATARCQEAQSTVSPTPGSTVQRTKVPATSEEHAYTPLARAPNNCRQAPLDMYNLEF